MGIDKFRIWYEEEGKDMLPIKESLEDAWLNGEYTIKHDNTCENCRYGTAVNSGYVCSDGIKQYSYNKENKPSFGCNEYNL